MKCFCWCRSSYLISKLYFGSRQRGRERAWEGEGKNHISVIWNATKNEMQWNRTDCHYSAVKKNVHIDFRENVAGHFPTKRKRQSKLNSYWMWCEEWEVDPFEHSSNQRYQYQYKSERTINGRLKISIRTNTMHYVCVNIHSDTHTHTHTHLKKMEKNTTISQIYKYLKRISLPRIELKWTKKKHINKMRILRLCEMNQNRCNFIFVIDVYWCLLLLVLLYAVFRFYFCKLKIICWKWLSLYDWIIELHGVPVDWENAMQIWEVRFSTPSTMIHDLRWILCSQSRKTPIYQLFLLEDVL